MPRGTMWKASVDQLDDRFEIVRDRLDKLIDMDDKKKSSNMRVFNNGNTVVEVSVKTRKNHDGANAAANGGGTKWDSILSQDNQEVSRPPTASLMRKKKQLSYAAPTKSSRTKSLQPATSLRKSPKTRNQSSENGPQPKFLARTLRIFLFEMRSALRSIPEASDAHKILDDLEFVAENLSLSNDGSNGGETALAVPASRPEHDHMIERLKREHQVHQQEARDLKTQLSKINQQFVMYEEESAKKDAKLAESQEVINRLATNNNDMLALLTSKADLEESLAAAQAFNRKLSSQLEGEKTKRKQLQTELVKAQKESAHLSQVVTKLKSKFSAKGLRDAYAEALASIGDPGVDAASAGGADGTVDIDISDSYNNCDDDDGDRTSKNVSDVEEDSAIGNSESVTAPATARKPEEQQGTTPETTPISREEESRLSLGQEIMRIQRQSQLMRRAQELAQRQQLAEQKQQHLEEKKQLAEIKQMAVAKRKIEEHKNDVLASFNALPWEETLNSSEASCGPLPDDSSLQETPPPPPPPPPYGNSGGSGHSGSVLERSSVNLTPDTTTNQHAVEELESRKRAALKEAGAVQEAKVIQFLDKMRNDKKFQITLSSGVGGGEGTAGKGAESTMNLDLSEEESALAALTESKFRQGLEASLDLPTTDND